MKFLNDINKCLKLYHLIILFKATTIINAQFFNNTIIGEPFIR